MNEFLKPGVHLISRAYGEGEITNVDNEGRITVQFAAKTSVFGPQSVLQGFLRFKDETLQNAFMEEERKKNDGKKASIASTLKPREQKPAVKEVHTAIPTENPNVIILKHHPMNVKFTNAFYLNQVPGNLSDYVVIDVTSRVTRDKEFMAEHPAFAKDLSPFYIGPVTSSDGVRANIFELFWQCGKVYPCHDDNGKPNDAYFTWRNFFYAKTSCTKDLMRHACQDLGYSHHDTLYFAYYNKNTKEWEALDYVTSRKKVYIPEYCKLVCNTESFRWMKSLLKEGKKIALVDFDGFNYYYFAEMERRYESYLSKCERDGTPIIRKKKDFTSIRSIKDAINSPIPVGHAFSLKLLLDGDITVNPDGSINDPYKILE